MAMMRLEQGDTASCDESGEELIPGVIRQVDVAADHKAWRVAAIAMMGIGAVLLVASPLVGEMQPTAPPTPPWDDFARQLSEKPLLLKKLNRRAIIGRDEDMDSEEEKLLAGDKQLGEKCEKKVEEANKELFGGVDPSELVETLKPCSEGDDEKCEEELGKLDDEVKDKPFLKLIVNCGANHKSKECKSAGKDLHEAHMKLRKECMDKGGKMCHVHHVGFEKGEEPECVMKDCFPFMALMEDQLSEEAGVEVEIHCGGEHGHGHGKHKEHGGKEHGKGKHGKHGHGKHGHGKHGEHSHKGKEDKDKEEKAEKEEDEEEEEEEEEED